MGFSLFLSNPIGENVGHTKERRDFFSPTPLRLLGIWRRIDCQVKHRSHRLGVQREKRYVPFAQPTGPRCDFGSYAICRLARLKWPPVDGTATAFRGRSVLWLSLGRQINLMKR